MTRHGSTMSLRVIVIAVVLVVLAVLVLGVVRGGVGDFDSFTHGNIKSSDINTCANKVQGFCQQDDNAEDDWTKRYPECEEHASAISGPDVIQESGQCARSSGG